MGGAVHADEVGAAVVKAWGQAVGGGQIVLPAHTELHIAGSGPIWIWSRIPGATAAIWHQIWMEFMH